jgi:uncharacterized protein YkwD
LFLPHLETIASSNHQIGAIAMRKFLHTLLLLILLTGCAPAPSNSPAAAVTAPHTQAPPPTAQAGATIPPTGTASTDPAADPNTVPSAVPTESSSVDISSNPSDCSDSASFVADVTVQDNELFQPGEKFDKIWRIKNTGNCTWSSQYTLVFAKGDQMNAPDSSPLQETLPGNTVDMTVKMAAPSDENISRARADFEIHNSAGAAIPVDTGTSLWVIIQVAGANAPKHDPTVNTGPGYANATCGYTTNQSKVNEVIAALNAYRAQQGLAPYTVNAQLTEAAQAHSADMACNQLFYHNGSNGSTAKSRVAASGYVATAVTENVYGSYPPLSGPDVILWWANDVADPRHNQNLLSTRYVEIGIGYSFYNNFGFFVIDFATP